jgi:hypothetical protein
MNPHYAAPPRRGTPWWIYVLAAIGFVFILGCATCVACVYGAKRWSDPKGVRFRVGGNTCPMEIKYEDDKGKLHEGEVQWNDWEGEKRYWRSEELQGFERGTHVKIEVWNFNCSASAPPTCSITKDGVKFGTVDRYLKTRSAVCEGDVP